MLASCDELLPRPGSIMQQLLEQILDESPLSDESDPDSYVLVNYLYKDCY